MNGLTDSGMRHMIKSFSGLDKAYELCSCPSLNGTYIGEDILGTPDFVSELESLSLALLRLRSWIEDARMLPILKRLFAPKSGAKTVKVWDQALSEIFAFAYFESHSVLRSIGWPADFPSDAPFDFALEVEGVTIAGDVKPANGS